MTRSTEWNGRLPSFRSLAAQNVTAAQGLRAVTDTVYWVALLRYVGCTGHAHEVATVFGDEIAIRAQTLVHDAANPAEGRRGNA
jgi:hypothetical protein